MPEATALLTSMLPVSDTETILANLASERAQAAKLSQDAVEAAIRKFLLSDLMALTKTEDLMKELRKRFQKDPLSFSGKDHVTFAGEDSWPCGETIEDCVYDWDHDNKRKEPITRDSDIELGGYLSLGTVNAKYDQDNVVEIIK